MFLRSRFSTTEPPHVLGCWIVFDITCLWLLSQADITKSIQKGILRSYSSLIMSNIENSSQWAFTNPVLFSRKLAPKKCKDKTIGCSSSLGLFPLHIVGLQCFKKPVLWEIRAQLQVNCMQQSQMKIMAHWVNRKVQAQRQKCIIQIHTCTLMNEEAFYEKPPTYMLHNLGFQ